MNFFTALGLVFIVLKLTAVISWSWWLVTMPLWIGMAIVIAMVLFGGTIWGLASLFSLGRR